MRVLYFSIAADHAGCRVEDWEVLGPLSLDAFWGKALERHPKLDAVRGACRLAVNGIYVAEGASIAADSEVAVIPPVSGG